VSFVNDGDCNASHLTAWPTRSYQRNPPARSFNGVDISWSTVPLDGQSRIVNDCTDVDTVKSHVESFGLGCVERGYQKMAIGEMPNDQSKDGEGELILRVSASHKT
jgi:hypothetical protein